MGENHLRRTNQIVLGRAKKAANSSRIYQAPARQRQEALPLHHLLKLPALLDVLCHHLIADGLG